MRKLIAFVVGILCLQLAHAQVTNDLFTPRGSSSRNFQSIVRQAESLELNSARLQSLRSAAAPQMELSIPFENSSLRLSLRKVKLTSDNFTVVERMPGGMTRNTTYDDGVFYQGTIAGRPNTFATFSIIGDQVMSIISDERSNIILGSIEENGRGTSEYTMYRDADLLINNPANCFTEDDAVPGEEAPATGASPARGQVVGEPIDIHFECDFALYQARSGNVSNVTAYVLAFFNNVQLLYANEDLHVQISQITVWTTQDPEAANNLNTSLAVLNSFSDRMASTPYIGDYSHFLSTRSLGGGIAWRLPNPCATGNPNYYRSAVSGINNGFSNFPTYSWTVQVVTHELGHNFGSHHTHWCGWNNGNGPIDDCATPEPINTGGPTCPPGPTPTNGGTIMSYCHLSGIGINFNNGFGPQPGDRIRNVMGSAACMATCRMTIAVNPVGTCAGNNGSASVTITNAPSSTVTYAWSNGQTGATATGLAAGTYYVTVRSGDCQVVEDFTITNNGSVLNFQLTPSGTAGYCVGGNITLAGPPNPAYTYVWRRGTNVISGATTNTYVANQPGEYSLTITSGACSGTQSVTLSEVPQPIATINVGGATTFCEGGNVVLNGDQGSSYTYQWFRGTDAIAGATGTTYTATQSGNYTVRVSAGSNCSATSSAVSVTVNPSPAVNITASGPLSFCSGGSVTLTTATATGYTHQWFNGADPVGTGASYTASASGSYTVRTTVGPCQRTSAATVVTVLLTPTVTVSPVTSTIQKFQTQVITALGAASYNWSAQPDLTNSTTNTGTFRPLSTRTYTIEGTAANGCKGTATATINVIGCGEATEFNVQHYSPSRVLISWTNPQDVSTDTLEYRKVGTMQWTRVFVSGNSYELNGLDIASDYEYRIIPLCTTTTVNVASATQTFRTGGLGDGVFVRLFPNPVNSNSRLEIIAAENITVQANVYDNSGKLVMFLIPQASFAPGQTIRSVDASKLASGVYYLAISINGKMEHIKMIVAH